MATIKVGISDQDAFTLPDLRARRRLLNRVAAAGLDHITVGDHIGFHGGTGFDGLITASTLLASHESLPVLVGVYLLGLRHPMLAARQLSTLAQAAPGRLTLGIGVAGEDRREVSNAGVDPGTRGRRLDEALPLVRRLLAGEEVSHQGEFFTLEEARILPPRSRRSRWSSAAREKPRSAAPRRSATAGWACSAPPAGSRETREQILAAAADLGREAPPWFGVNVWCGLDPDAGRARDLLAAKMEHLYRLPYEKFRYLAPAGTPKQVAEFLRPFTEAGAEHVTLVPAGASVEAEIDAVAEVREYLQAIGRPIDTRLARW